jgi:hypothetical protein
LLTFAFIRSHFFKRIEKMRESNVVRFCKWRPGQMKKKGGTRPPGVSNLPALSRSYSGDPELWVSTHQVILTNWSRLNQVFDINFIHPKVRSSTMNKPDLDPI